MDKINKLNKKDNDISSQGLDATPEHTQNQDQIMQKLSEPT